MMVAEKTVLRSCKRAIQPPTNHPLHTFTLAARHHSTILSALVVQSSLQRLTITENYVPTICLTDRVDLASITASIELDHTARQRR